MLFRHLTHAIQQYMRVTAWWYQWRNITSFFCEDIVRGFGFQHSVFDEGPDLQNQQHSVDELGDLAQAK